ncbi:PREDICTED: probable glucan endo-1,3-beta-glucosidase A6 [Tarenaya hassleriana]|uniref:probable glucan endo-1,3-beta-glucosidase A6 n=1 Tax=Tarenaya hassleriana TaxID=28532 RepID=UPI00053C0C03|nr:PREDICTED: probable glucan endo-1,3-beta-glucosidase A6 [Tarenaya hassleriana]
MALSLPSLFLFTLLSLSRSRCFATGKHWNAEKNAVLGFSGRVGISYGRQGDNLPSPYKSINLIKSVNAGHVKLYDADPETLILLSQTNLRVTIMVQNHDIVSIGSDQRAADDWVRTNVLPYYPRTLIRFVLVGNEVLSYYNTDQDRDIWRNLVPAMRKIVKSLRAQGIHNVKVGTPLAMDVLQSATTFPPSSGTFRDDIAFPVMLPLLKFLNGTNSFFFIDVYPYFPWSSDPVNTGLDFALFEGNTTYTDPKTGLVYSNLLDQMLDSVISAMSNLGYPSIRLAISGTGWPNSGDIDEIGASVRNAATYNRNLIKKMTADPPIGTPARPGSVIPTFVFSLFDENRKPGPGTERHWGILRPSGTPVYEIDFTGRKPVSGYGPPAKPGNGGVGVAPCKKRRAWCVVKEGADVAALGQALGFACGRSNETCSALAPGRECYQPVTITWHASYAFSSYWAQFRSQNARCYFNGLARETTVDPGNGRCKFPSVAL